LADVVDNSQASKARGGLACGTGLLCGSACYTLATMRRIFALILLASLPTIAADEFTLYELLPPETHQFAITYDVTATREGAQFFFNPVRPGSTASKERVISRSTGKDLKFELVSGKDAKATGLVPAQTADTAQFIKVYLPVPVPKGGETRIRIFKTYTDAPSYYVKDGLLIFDRPLGIKRNVVVLPAGWELVGSASPAIVSTDPDGRMRVSFLNDRDDQLPVKITARRLP
ncbi:MAG TPA: hypothetical protein VJ723_13435, partial [Candidatus Angelobacter sp.]|nr:hypothetical protein [Candidatus Angelobacter sp.]